MTFDRQEKDETADVDIQGFVVCHWGHYEVEDFTASVDDLTEDETAWCKEKICEAARYSGAFIAEREPEYRQRYWN